MNRWICSMRKKEKARRVRVEAWLEDLSGRVLQLECPHTAVQFCRLSGFDIDCFVKRCRACGKTLDRFGTEKGLREAELEYEEERCAAKLTSLGERLEKCSK